MKTLMTLFLILILGALMKKVEAQDTYFSGGQGTVDNPYQNSTVQQLDSLRYFLGSTHAGTHYRLMNNIDLTSFLSGKPTGWTPIGSAAGAASFQGNLHGGGHKITGMRMNYASLNRDYVGFFGYLQLTAVVDILGIEIVGGNAIVGASSTGVIAGFNVGNISSCYVIGAVSGKYNVGGLVEYNNLYCLADCFTTLGVLV